MTKRQIATLVFQVITLSFAALLFLTCFVIAHVEAICENMTIEYDTEGEPYALKPWQVAAQTLNNYYISITKDYKYWVIDAITIIFVLDMIYLYLNKEPKRSKETSLK